jgi:hypothetical protein
MDIYSIPFLDRPSGVTFIGVMMIASGVLRNIYTPETWNAVIGALYLVVAIGLLSLDQWARAVTIAVAILEVGLIGRGLVIVRGNLPLIALLVVFLKFLFYASVLGYLLMPRIGRAFIRRMADVSVANSEAKS